MVDDIVTRLREEATDPELTWLDAIALLAADEIENLRIKCKHLEAEVARLERLNNG